MNSVYEFHGWTNFTLTQELRKGKAVYTTVKRKQKEFWAQVKEAMGNKIPGEYFF